MLCGSAGCGKTLLAVEFLVRGAAQFNEPGVFVSFEESSPELAENVRSLGFNLEQWVARKKIAVDHVAIERSEIEETGEYDLEGLFIRLDHAVKSVGAKRIVLDTLEALFSGLSNEAIVRAELRRLFRPHLVLLRVVVQCVAANARAAVDRLHVGAKAIPAGVLPLLVVGAALFLLRLCPILITLRSLNLPVAVGKPRGVQFGLKRKRP